MPRVNGQNFLQQDPGSNDLNPSIPDVNPFIQQPANSPLSTGRMPKVISCKTLWRYAAAASDQNPLESPFAALRLRTDAAKHYKRVAGPKRDLEDVDGRRRVPNRCSELMKNVYLGALYADGIVIEAIVEKIAA